MIMSDIRRKLGNLYRSNKNLRILIYKTKVLSTFFTLLRAAMLSGAIGFLLMVIENHKLLNNIFWIPLIIAILLFLAAVMCGIRYLYCKNLNIRAAVKAEKQYNLREDRIKKDSKNKKAIHIVFMSDSPTNWTTFDELYFLLKKDPRFTVTVLANPDFVDGKMENYDMIDFLDQKGIQYIKGYNKKKFFNIAKLEPHYIFPSRPYDSHRPKKYKNKKLALSSRLCHILYGALLASGKILDMVYDFSHYKYYDVIFSETPELSRLYEMKQREKPLTRTEIYLAGSSKFDAIYYGDFKPSESDYRHSILYTPRWNLFDGTSSFLDLKDKFFEMVKEYPDIEFIFRPHPLMERTYRSKNELRDVWESFIQQFDEHDNAVIDNEADYLPTFKRATIMLSDFTSLLAEFLLTKKPIVYFNKKDSFNSFGEYIAQSYYWCENKKEVSDTINDLIQGNDPKKDIRSEVIQNGFFFGKQTAACEIRDYLIRDYFYEEE